MDFRQHVIYKKTKLILIPKQNIEKRRTMYTLLEKTGKILYHGVKGIPKGTPVSRDFSTFQCFTRIAEPENCISPPMLRDPKTNLEIMHPVDYNVKKVRHFYLIDIDDMSGEYWKVYGAFTTSYSKFQGKYPRFMSNFTLYGKNVTQYFHEYTSPRLIRRDSVSVDMLANYGMSHPEYQEIFKTLKIHETSI